MSYQTRHQHFHGCVVDPTTPCLGAVPPNIHIGTPVGCLYPKPKRGVGAAAALPILHTPGPVMKCACVFSRPKAPLLPCLPEKLLMHGF